MFGRSGLARSDFMAVVSNPFFHDMTPANKANVYAWLAVFAHRQNEDGNTQDWLSKAKAADAATASEIWERYK